MKRYLLIIIIILGFNLWLGAINDKGGSQLYGQSEIAKKRAQEEKERDPFRLPPGVKLLVSREEEKEVNKGERKEKREEEKKSIMVESIPDQKPRPSFPSFVIKAILISERIRLAAIEDRLVTEGALIGEERVIEIKPDRVILGKGEERRTLYLPQSPIPLKVEEK